MAHLTLPESIYQAMLAHARADFPNEACGLLRGREGLVVEILTARNISSTPRSDYEVDPETLLRALAWEDEGDALIAIYHSHPASPAYPSAVDAAKAFYPDSVYLILSLQNPHAPQLAGFFLRPEIILRGNAAAKLLREMVFTQVRPGLRSLYLPSEHPRLEGLPDDTPSQVAFYLIFDENDSHPSPIVRLISVQPVTLTIQL